MLQHSDLDSKTLKCIDPTATEVYKWTALAEDAPSAGFGHERICQALSDPFRRRTS